MARFQIGGFTFTRHALERIVEMSLTCDQVEDMLRRPDSTRPSRSSSGRPARMLTADRHHFAVVADESHDVVITVVFRTNENYRRCGSTYEVKK